MTVSEERVQRGAAVLDGFRPGWASTVNVDELEIASMDDCVLGQVFGDFGDGLHYVMACVGSVSPHEVAFDYGFDARGESYLEDATELNELWKAVILERASPGLAAPA